MAHSLFKLVENDDKSSFSLCTSFQENSLDLIVLQGNCAWKSKIKWNEIQKFASQHKMKPEDFFDKLKDCIETTSPDVTLSFMQNKFTVIRILENDLRVRFFMATLGTVVHEDCVNNLLLALYSDKLSMSTRLKQAEEALDKERKDKNEYKAKLAELIRKKNKDDGEVYGKFVLVLNEKKREIQHLRELLDAFQSGRPRANPVVDVKSRKRKKEPVQKKEVVSESGSDDEDNEEISNYNTSDDDNDNEENQAKKINLDEDITNPESDTDEIKEIKPSTSSTLSRFLEDSPPRELLTKKIPSKENVDTSVSHPKASQPKEATPPPVEEQAEPPADQPSSPVVDFNTQDLLEML